MNKRKLWVSILAGFLAVVMVLGLVVGVLPELVNAESISELQQQVDKLKEDKAEIDAKIDELEEQLSDNLDSMTDVVNQKETIDQEIFNLYLQVENLNEQIATYGLLIADKQEELDEAQEHLDTLSAQNKERIRAMEEDGNLSYWSVLFKANDFADLLDRMNMVQEIAAADQRRLKEMSDAAIAVQTAKEALEAEKVSLEESKEELTASQTLMEEKRAEADKLLAELVATGEEYEKLLEEAEKEAGKIDEDLNDYQDRLDEAEYQQWLSTSVPTPTSPSSGGGNTSGATWLVPCSYILMTSPFGYRYHPIGGDYRFHYGVDLAGNTGTPIKATRSGVVTAASYNSSGGYYVTIDHQDGYKSQYLHMTHYIVSPGQYVNAGQVIGYMGSTGASTGPHLHFAIIKNGTYVNPANYINI